MFLPAIGVFAWVAHGCAGDNANGTGGSPATTTSTTGQGGDNTGGAGGGGGGDAGGGGAAGCQSNADCANDPTGTVCDIPTGQCVVCTETADICMQGQYCDPVAHICQVGCTDNSDCPGSVCDTSTNDCVGCLSDGDCPAGTICNPNSVCVPGCSGTQPCQPGFSCCSAVCYDLATDEYHCGTCSNVCDSPPHAEPLCNNGVCQMGACIGAYEDCNGVANDGCEQNVLQDGACVCTPGSTQSCYQGAPGTEGVGVCHAGIRTCLPSGTAWGPCSGQVMPTFEICANGIDEDCNGTVDDALDLDGDGWTYCNGDCCDLGIGNCGAPNLVNPGAFEVVGNGVDDDCDPNTSDITADVCTSAEKFSSVTATDVGAAIELCKTTTANPPLPQKTWGVISTTQLLANGSTPTVTQLSNIQNNQTAILVNYGTGGVLPQKGPTMAGISSGMMRDEGDPGFVLPNGGTPFGSLSQPPADYLAAHGGSLPSSAGCSGTCPAGSGANDPVNIRFTIRVPTNAQSFSYNFRFFSAEYWTFSCTQYNDFYLALLQSNEPSIPADKNISFDSQNNPVSVNNGFFDVCVAKGCYTCPAGFGALAGTGMEVGNTGGATKWLTTDAPVVPGEVIQLEFTVFDVSDDVLDSLTLIDNFRWNLAPAVLNTHE